MPDSRTEPRNTLPPLTRLLMVAETIEELFSDDADVLCEIHAELAAELDQLRAEVLRLRTVIDVFEFGR